MTFMFHNFGWRVSLGPCTKSLLVCLSKCPFFAIWKTTKVSLNPIQPSRPQETLLRDIQAIAVFNEWLQLTAASAADFLGCAVCTTATWKCFLLSSSEFTTLALWAILVLLDLGFGFLYRNTGELHFKEIFFECEPLLPEHGRPDCHGDCRQPVEWLFMAFHSSVRS